MKTNKPYLILEFGNSALAFAAGHCLDAEPIITQAGRWEYPVGVDKDNIPNAAEWLKQKIAGEGIKIKDVRISVPAEELFWTKVDLPPGNAEENKQMLELRLERELPLSPELLSVDWVNVLTDAAGNQIYNVIAIKKSLLNRYVKILQAAGLKLTGIEPSIISFARGLSRYYPNLSDGIFLAVKDDNVEQVNLVQGKITSCKYYQAAGEVVLAEVDSVLVNQIQQGVRLQAIQSQTAIPANIYLSGQDEKITSIKRLFKEGDGFQVLLLNTQNPAISFNIMGKENPTGLLTLIGNLLIDTPACPACDLNKPRLFGARDHKIAASTRKFGYGVVAGIVLILLFGGSYYLKAAKYNRLKSEYSKYSRFLSAADKALTDASTMISFKEQQVSVLTLIAKLSEAWGEKAYLKVLTFDRSKDITLVGAAANSQAVAELLNRLNNSGLFTDAKLTYIRTSQRNPDYPVEFGLSLKWKRGFDKLNTIKTVAEKNGGQS
jgi:hypothetical protein